MPHPSPDTSGDPLRRATPPPVRDARADDRTTVAPLLARLVGRRAATLLLVAAVVAAVALLERALAGPARGPLPLWLAVLVALGATGVGVALRRIDAAAASGRADRRPSPRRRAAARGWRSLARRAE